MKETMETLRLFFFFFIFTFMSEEFKNKEETLERRLQKIEEKYKEKFISFFE